MTGKRSRNEADGGVAPGEQEIVLDFAGQLGLRDLGERRAQSERDGEALRHWIDRKNSLGGFWMRQNLPFAVAVSFAGYMDFEPAVYRITDIRQAA